MTQLHKILKRFHNYYGFQVPYRLQVNMHVSGVLQLNFRSIMYSNEQLSKPSFKQVEILETNVKYVL